MHRHTGDTLTPRSVTPFITTLSIAAALILTTLSTLTPVVLNPHGTASSDTTASSRAHETLTNRELDDASLTVTTLSDLAVLGAIPVWGYVNVLGDNDEIFIQPEAKFNSAVAYSDTVLHERAHIGQRRLIEARVGKAQGLPRVIAALELDAELRKHSPELQPGKWFAGLEASASCAVGLSVGVVQQSWYLDATVCDSNAAAAAQAVREGVWPDAAAVERFATEALRAREAAAASRVASERAQACKISTVGKRRVKSC